MTFTYAASTSKAAAIKATALVHGRVRVVGHGQVKGRKLRLKLRHLKRGRYHLTLLRRTRHTWVVTGHSTLVIS